MQDTGHSDSEMDWPAWLAGWCFLDGVQCGQGCGEKLPSPYRAVAPHLWGWAGVTWGLSGWLRTKLWDGTPGPPPPPRAKYKFCTSKETGEPSGIESQGQTKMHSGTTWSSPQEGPSRSCTASVTVQIEGSLPPLTHPPQWSPLQTSAWQVCLLNLCLYL